MNAKGKINISQPEQERLQVKKKMLLVSVIPQAETIGYRVFLIIIHFPIYIFNLK